MGDNAYFRAPIKWLNEDETGGVCVASYVRGGHGLCVYRRFVRNRTGESTLSPTRLRNNVNGDIQRKGWEGGGLEG